MTSIVPEIRAGLFSAHRGPLALRRNSRNLISALETPRESSLSNFRATAGLSLVVLTGGPALTAEDVHSTKFWISHCKKADMACIGYLQAMLDINNLDRESGAPVKWCAPRQLVLDDRRKTILRGLRAKPIAPEVPFVEVRPNDRLARHSLESPHVSDRRTDAC